MGAALSDGLWPAQQTVSSKGPYGQTGLYGKTEEEPEGEEEKYRWGFRGPYSCISEEEFWEGVAKGYVHFVF